MPEAELSGLIQVADESDGEAGKLCLDEFVLILKALKMSSQSEQGGSQNDPSSNGLFGLRW